MSGKKKLFKERLRELHKLRKVFFGVCGGGGGQKNLTHGLTVYKSSLM